MFSVFRFGIWLLEDAETSAAVKSPKRLSPKRPESCEVTTIYQHNLFIEFITTNWPNGSRRSLFRTCLTLSHSPVLKVASYVGGD